MTKSRVLHGPEELGYPAMTEATVNIRATLDEAVKEDVLDSGLAAHFAGFGKALFYKERSWRTILRLAADRGLPRASVAGFAARLQRGQVNQKRVDALELVAAIRGHLATAVIPLNVSYPFRATGYHQAASGQFKGLQRCGSFWH